MLPEASRMNMTLGLTVVPVVEVPSGVVARSMVAAAAVPAEAANVSANTSLRYLRPDGCLMVSPNAHYFGLSRLERRAGAPTASSGPLCGPCGSRRVAMTGIAVDGPGRARCTSCGSRGLSGSCYEKQV